MKTSKMLALGALCAGLAASFGSGCGADGATQTGFTGAGAGAATGSGAGMASSTSSGQGAGSGQGGFDFDGGSNDAMLDPDSACAVQNAAATLQKKPVDIIVVIDNSGSMTQEIVGVQTNINQNFATILDASGLDYRVILVARHGSAASGQSICVEAPLSGIPAGGCTPPPAQPVNKPPRFFHYSTEIASLNSWCKVLTTFGTPDEFNFAPTGWSEWLRPDAYKTFVEITDDRVSCAPYNDLNTAAGGTAAAAQFDAALLALSPAHFGDAAQRNYSFYSIVAMAYNNPPSKPYAPADPIVTGKCPTAANPGTGYQALSVLTGALRFPLCDTSSYDAVFQAIAAGVISGAKIACDFPVPTPPVGKKLDPKSVVVQYTPGGMGNPQSFTQVADASACAPGSFYLQGDTIFLCPEACALAQADPKAAINVLFACDPGGVN